MATKNGNGQQALKTDPTAVAEKRLQIPNWARAIINTGFLAREEWAKTQGSNAEGFLEGCAADKKRLLAWMNGLLKNQKPAA